MVLFQFARQMEERIRALRFKLKSPTSSFQKVDILNELSWLLRYEDTREAQVLCTEARKLAVEINYPRGIAYALLYQAVTRFLLSPNGDLIQNLLDALEYFEKTEEEETGLSKCMNFLAMTNESYGDYERGLQFAQKALREAEQIGYREGKGDALSTLGLIYSRLCDFDKSLESYNDSLAIRKEIGNNKAISSSLNLIARTHSLTGDYEKALHYYQQSLELRTKTKDKSGMPWTHLGIASLYEKTEDYDQALEHYQTGLKLNKSLGEKRCQLQCLMGEGRVYLRLGKLKEGSTSLQQSIKLAEELKAKPLIFETNLALAEYYELSGEYHKALEHFKQYQQMEKEVLNAEVQNRMKNQQIAFAVERSKREAEIYQLKNVELKKAYDEIEEKNTEITDSIRYAKRIQDALLPPEEVFTKFMPEYFILFRPRDIVSGDFYWMTEKDHFTVIVVADCTGHGIPGAFMSMLGVSFLNDIVGRMKNLQANRILEQLRSQVIESLHQTGKEGEAKDGMDISLCIFNHETKELQFSGAFNSTYHIRKGELTELKADRMPIAIHWKMDAKFTNQEIQILKGDTVYLFSDGYADQFGGPEGKKFKGKQLKDLLLSIQDQPLDEQKTILEDNFDEWKGTLPQVDDVILMGLKFN